MNGTILAVVSEFRTIPSHFNKNCEIRVAWSDIKTFYTMVVSEYEKDWVGAQGMVMWLWTHERCKLVPFLKCTARR